MSEDNTICPYCGLRMKKWRVPAMSTWSAEFFYVCFNDECKFFVKGWDHMYETRGVRVSYRHRYDPDAGTGGPIPVWDKDALKDGIIE